MKNTMIDVFVSRPTWVPPSFRQGLEGFLGLLTSLGLNPRTLGATDYPSKAPLDEVIRLMQLCSGAIILGYPQIVASGGSIKDEPFSGELLLPTEWNHIEAGLAYAREIPLLVVHHFGVRRGIFDRGAIANFIYELNLEDPSWPLAANIRGAVGTWRKDVLERPRGGHVQPEKAAPTSTVQAAILSDDHVRVLHTFATSSRGRLTAEEIAEEQGVSLEKAKYFVDGLLQGNYIGRSLVVGAPPTFFLVAGGRTLLVERGLL